MDSDAEELDPLTHSTSFGGRRAQLRQATEDEQMGKFSSPREERVFPGSINDHTHRPTCYTRSPHCCGMNLLARPTSDMSRPINVTRSRFGREIHIRILRMVVEKGSA